MAEVRYTVVVNELSTNWYKEGTNIFHREGGPAIEYAYGGKSYYLEGVKYSKEVYDMKIESMRVPKDNLPKSIVIDGVEYVRKPE